MSTPETVYEQESLAEWFKTVLDFPTYRRATTQQFSRPGILLEKPRRRPKPHASGKEMLVSVTQDGTIFTRNEAETMQVSADLLAGLGAAGYRLPILQIQEINGVKTTTKIGAIRKIELEIKDAASWSAKEARGLDIPFVMKYEVTLVVPQEPDPPLNHIISKGYSVTFRVDAEVEGG